MVTKHLSKLVFLVAVLNSVACARDGFDSNSNSQTQFLSNKSDNSNFQTQAVDNLIPGVSGPGNPGTGQPLPGPGLPLDIAGDYIYSSASLTFKLRLESKMQTIVSGQTVSATPILGEHKAYVTADCTAVGDEKDILATGQIKFSNFVAPAIGGCDKAVYAANLLMNSKSFTRNQQGNLSITLLDGRVLNLVATPIDWSGAIGL